MLEVGLVFIAFFGLLSALAFLDDHADDRLRERFPEYFPPRQ